MATVTHTVKKGETLSSIANKYNCTVSFLAQLNNIKNPNLIYVGQVLIIAGAPTSTASTNNATNASSSSSTTSSTAVSITNFGIQAGTDRTIYAMWAWSRANTDHYEVKWYYKTSDGKSFIGNQTTIKASVKQDTYNPPNNAVGVIFKIKPVSTTKKENNKEVSWWTGSWVSKTYTFSQPTNLTTTATITNFGIQAGTDRTVYATWNWSKSNTDHYEVKWQYITSDDKIFEGDTRSVTTKNSTYTPPTNAAGVVFAVKPVSSNNSWTASWTTNKRYYFTTIQTDNMTTAAIITQFGLQSNTDSTVFAAWDWSRMNTKHYEILWHYITKDGNRFIGSETTNQPSNKQSTYSAPSNAVGVVFKMRPVSNTKTVNGQEVSYWTVPWTSSKTYYFANNPPSVPPVPTVKVEDNKLTARVSNLESNTTEVQFEIVQNDNWIYNTGMARVQTGVASYSCTVLDGRTYKVRCRGKKDAIYSDWSDYSDISEILLKPSAPSGITSCVATSETSVKLTWGASPTADSYDIEYATERDYLGASNASSIINNATGTTYIVTGLESGHTYYFRVRAVNKAGESGWTSIASTIIGTKPEAPTTWSSTSTAITGDTVYLYWVHNCEDNSKQTKAELELTIDGQVTVQTITNTSDSDENETSFYTLSTKSYSEGVSIQWRVRTAGVTNEYGDWSIQRTIDVYAPPTLSINITDENENKLYTINSFPFFIVGEAGPATQKPISYHVTVVANSSYETVDEIGNLKIVSKGQEIYSKFYDIDEKLLLYLTPNSIDLENDTSYTIKCVVTMNSGLNAEESIDFEVAWVEGKYAPNAEIIFDPDTLSAAIRPYCEIYPNIFYKVIYDPSTGNFYRTGEILTDVSGESVNECYTEQYEDIVYYGLTGDNESVFFCVAQDVNPQLIENVSLSVYRREYDGRFVEIGKNLVNTENTFVTDPHPSLDYARYRIVATSNETGAVSYTDIPGYHVGEKSVIIQWDESWSNFDTTEEAQLATPSWTGSMLKLPYNIDVSDSNSMDVSMIQYVGRSHPVSYYGTQLGVTATWNVEIPKYDKNTLYGLRRLAIYMGDVYVREPSGSGYWAHVAVSFSQTHCELTIPVTLELTRVEGGV